MRRDTVLVPEHIQQLLASGHDPHQVLELLDTYSRLQRLQRQDERRSRRWRRPGTVAQVVPLFPSGTGDEICEAEQLTPDPPGTEQDKEA